MNDTFDPVDFLAFLRRNARFLAISIGTATAVTAIACFATPARYTATATLVIEPPIATDPRAATAVTPVYLESLRTYEQFAGSDTLFAKACAQFHLADAPGEPCTESFKRRVLRVTKLKDTKLMQLAVTLPEPKLAQQVVEYLANETVTLNKTLARDADHETVGETEVRLKEAREEAGRARTEYETAGAAGSEALLTEELKTLGELKSRASMELLRSQTDIAELSVRNPAEAALERSRADSLTKETASLDKRLATQSAALAGIRARRERAFETLKATEERLETWSRRANETSATSGLRTEQLRIVDPGVIPTQPSFPNPPLFIAAAAFVGTLLSFAFLCLRYGLTRSSRRAEIAEMSSDYKASRRAHR